MKSCRRSTGSRIRRKGRYIPLETEKLTEELVKKVEEKQCMDCKYFKIFYLKYAPCCGCENKNHHEEEAT